MASSSAGDPPADLPALSAEIWDRVCSHMSKPTLFQLRLVSRQLSDIAVRWAYRSLRLEGYGTSAERFAKIACSPKLRGLVRELTIDTWIGPDFDYNSNGSYEIPEAFMNNLPYLRGFGKLTALHLRFSEYCGEDDRSGMTVEETWDLRYRVLDTIFHCVAGMWTKERQVQIDEAMEEMDSYDWEPQYPHPEEDSHLPSGQVIHLRELTIANLADYHEPRLSKAWKKVLALPSLVDLKLFVATESCDAAPESSTHFAEKYEFFDNLPRSWLSPAVANNLRVLSLYYREYWGWFPKMDFRSIGQGSPFPQLKVLAFGNYVFSHEWQVDWLASVGKNNGSGGLEELYLDDCPVLFRARQTGPFSSSDRGYPDTGTVLGQNWNPEEHDYPMRWNYILRRWAESMKALKVFRMGQSCWSGAPGDTLNAMDHDSSYDDIDSNVREHLASYQQHRDFSCPAPIDQDGDEDPELAWKAGKHLHGTGMEGSRVCQMQYIEYNIGLGPSPWIETRRYYPGEPPFEPEDGTVAEDDAAFEALMTAVEARAGA